MDYSYIRVSRLEQNILRQIDGVKAYCPTIKEENIYYDKKSGKDLNRQKYLELRSVLKPHDVLIIHELDRLGRNKAEIKSELVHFRELGVIIRVLNVPTTLMTLENQDWLLDMVNNILIEVYSTLAENERTTLVTRTMEGLEAARKRGRIGGRPPIAQEKINIAYELWKTGNFNISETCEMAGINRSTFYKYAEKNGINIQDKPKPSDANIKCQVKTHGENASRKGVPTSEIIINRAIKMWRSSFPISDICKICGISRSTLYKYLWQVEEKTNRKK